MRKNRHDMKSQAMIYCDDCREHGRKRHKRTLLGRKEAVRVDQFVCSTCCKIKALLEKGDNALCVACVSMLASNAKRKETFQGLIFERTLEKGCACERCKSVFIRGDNHYDYMAVENVDGVLNFKGESYAATDFITRFKDQLETRFLEFDHLPQSEAIALGIPGAADDFEQKTNCVRDMGSMFTMKREARFTQLLCLKCHTEATMSRENSDRHGQSISFNQKRAYVDQFKRDAGKCIKCELWLPNLLRFFHLDHIDRTLKVDSVANMVKIGLFTLADIQKECTNVQVTCGHCHKIKTSVENDHKPKRRKLDADAQ